MKEFIKKYLNRFGFYKSFKYLWNHRPNLHSLCINAGYRVIGAPDKLAIPPDNLIFQVIISREIAWYLHSGRMSYQSILYTIRKQGLNIEDFKAVLDFGCGCGRVIRYWESNHGTRIFGSDYNPDLINWCKKKLNKKAQFYINHLEPPISFPDDSFDLVYAISVFTHLPCQLQYDWMKELARIIKPGKFLMISLHGESRFFDLDPEEQQNFNSGNMVLKKLGPSGSNIYGAYHPYEYVKNQLAKGFDLIDFIPQGMRDANQDIYLLKKGP